MRSVVRFHLELQLVPTYDSAGRIQDVDVRDGLPFGKKRALHQKRSLVPFAT